MMLPTAMAVLCGLIAPFNPMKMEPYRLEAPDIVVLEVTGLPKKKMAGLNGQHIVRLDGTINLGLTGSVTVSGLTLAETEQNIAKHLQQKFRYKHTIKVKVTLGSANSKRFYIIEEVNGQHQVQACPMFGNETVLDVVANNVKAVDRNTRFIYVARPSQQGHQILPVDWMGITKYGLTATNYQILSGDRVFVVAKPLNR